MTLDTSLLDPQTFKPYVDRFNADDVEDIVNLIPNAVAWDWMQSNVPLFDCPDETIREIYYYRWWTFRKHIKQTPHFTVITEFISDVRHAGAFNTISCALGFHLAEGRWLRDQSYLDEYTHYWFFGNEGQPDLKFHNYSSWFASAAWERFLVNGRQTFLLDLLDDFIADYARWEQEKQLPSGLFWQYDVRDGMEESITGSRKHKNARPTISSYMYANALAIADMATLGGHPDIAATYQAKAAELKKLVQAKLWDASAQFFKAQKDEGDLSDAREAIGYVPWCFNLPDRGYEAAWQQLTDPQGFWSPKGLNTAERRHPQFRSHGVGKCEWDGAAWPFATSQTLNALANVLRHYPQNYVTKQHYLDAVRIYAAAHQKDGKPYIGEYYDEVTGEWLKGDNPRSRYYNHSTYCDLIINGLVGLIPRADNTIELSPLLPEGAWDWFALDNVTYHGRTLSIVWDRDGQHYGRGQGLQVFVDGKRVVQTPTLGPVTATKE
jgi:hypothetical protein